MKNNNLFLFTLLACLLFTSCGSDNAKMTGKGIFGDIPQYLLKCYDLKKQCADELEFEDNRDKHAEIIQKYQELLDEYVDGNHIPDKIEKATVKEIPIVAPEELGKCKGNFLTEKMRIRLDDKHPDVKIATYIYSDNKTRGGCFFLDERDSVIFAPRAYYERGYLTACVSVDDFNPKRVQDADYLKFLLYVLDKTAKIKITSSEEETFACIQSYFRNADEFIKSLHEAGILECSSYKELSTGKPSSDKAEATTDNADKTKPGAIDLAFFNLRGPVKSVTEKNDSYDDTRRYGFSEKGKWETQNGQKIGSIFTDVKRDGEKRIIEYTEGEYDCIDSYKITYDAKTGWLAKCETSAGDGESTTTYTYDANGYAIKSVTIGEYADDEGGSKVNTTTTYTYVSFDDYGNWTKRTAKDSDGSAWTETRKIAYYK